MQMETGGDGTVAEGGRSRSRRSRKRRREEAGRRKEAVIVSGM